MKVLTPISLLLTSNTSVLNRLKNASPSELVYRSKRWHLSQRMKAKVLTKGYQLPVPNVLKGHLGKIYLPELFFAEEGGGWGKEENARFLLNLYEKIAHAFERGMADRYFADIPASGGGLDIRQVWEAGRLQRAMTLIQGGLARSDGAMLARAKDSLMKWIETNAFLMGPHYISSMECGLRVPVFVYGLKLIPNLSGEEQKNLLRAIYEHAWWVSRNLSLYASRGNHTLCEAMGLVFAGAVFKGDKEGDTWLSKGIGLLEEELCHQLLPDGGPAEQSLSYHRFILDIYWLCVDFLEGNRLHDCSGLIPGLGAGEGFIKALSWGDGAPPAIGDSDDGHAVAPGRMPNRRKAEVPQIPAATFADSGYTVIRNQDGILATFDHGPLGMPPLYNHGHADALSFTLAYRGKPVFIDPGTYRYNGVPEWRRYFKSTRAHNTVTIDGMDQAHQASGFIWSDPYESVVNDRRNTADGFSIEASHDGYCRLSSPLRHFRRVSYWSPDSFFIQDRFEGRGWHEFELNFHFGDTLAIDRHRQWWRLDFGSFAVYLRVLEPVEGCVAQGETDPVFGWRSPAYGVKKPSGVITFQQSGMAGEVLFSTAILIEGQERGMERAETGKLWQTVESDYAEAI